MYRQLLELVLSLVYLLLTAVSMVFLGNCLKDTHVPFHCTLTTLLVAQVIALMVLSMTHLLFLRFIEPLCERGELAVQLVAEICDVGVFVCGLVLILGDSSNDKFR